MEKEEYLEAPIPVEDEDDYLPAKESPPPYEEAILPISSRLGTLFPHRVDRDAKSTNTRSDKSFWRPSKALQFLLPDPKSIKCRCGAHVDTTKRSSNCPPERVRCMCGYIVSSSGYACPASHYSNLLPEDRKCGCGEALPDNGRLGAPFICNCLAKFDPDGSVKRFCASHQIIAKDARNVQCRCGRYVDTTAIWKIVHGTKSVSIAEANGSPWAGYSHYDYTLPEGQGRCSCGLSVMRDGTVVVGDHWQCCTISSCKSREVKYIGSEGSCTCA